MESALVVGEADVVLGLEQRCSLEKDKAWSKQFLLVDIAVLIPCYNEESAIEAVVAGFRGALPLSRIFVYDNNSRDRTAALGRAAGAIVRHERLQGKGHVVAH